MAYVDFHSPRLPYGAAAVRKPRVLIVGYNERVQELEKIAERLGLEPVVIGNVADGVNQLRNSSGNPYDYIVIQNSAPATPKEAEAYRETGNTLHVDFNAGRTFFAACAKDKLLAYRPYVCCLRSSALTPQLDVAARSLLKRWKGVFPARSEADMEAMAAKFFAPALPKRKAHEL